MKSVFCDSFCSRSVDIIIEEFERLIPSSDYVFAEICPQTFLGFFVATLGQKRLLPVIRNERLGKSSKTNSQSSTWHRLGLERLAMPQEKIETAAMRHQLSFHLRRLLRPPRASKLRKTQFIEYPPKNI
jgi:hypothetical protein